jgi:hypothetical protein
LEMFAVFEQFQKCLYSLTGVLLFSLSFNLYLENREVKQALSLKCVCNALFCAAFASVSTLTNIR